MTGKYSMATKKAGVPQGALKFLDVGNGVLNPGNASI